MAQEVVTNVVLVSTNKISDEEADDILEGSSHDSLEEYAASLEETVENLLAVRVFGEADDVPILSVDTFVEEDVEDYEKGVRP